LIIPDNQEFIANVTGALQALVIPDHWEKFGTLTPEQSAAALQDMFDQFCFGEGACHMVGEILCYATSISPDPSWLLCDGNSLLRAAYPDLFAVIGSLYGSVDATHFTIPDLRGRVIVGNGLGFGLTDRYDGDVFGEETHTLITAELAAHSHTDTGHAHSVDTLLPTAAGLEVTFASLDSGLPLASTGVGHAAISSTGSDTPHNNVQPCLCMSYFIVALP
jgi:microcystin-dependent protein